MNKFNVKKICCKCNKDAEMEKIDEKTYKCNKCGRIIRIVKKENK